MHTLGGANFPARRPYLGMTTYYLRIRPGTLQADSLPELAEIANRALQLGIPFAGVRAAGGRQLTHDEFGELLAPG